MKLLGSTENKIRKDKNGENISHLEITKVVLVHCNFVNNDYQQIQKSYTRLFPINRSVVYQKFLISYNHIISNHIILKTFNIEFNYIEVWFTDQNS